MLPMLATKARVHRNHAERSSLDICIFIIIRSDYKTISTMEHDLISTSSPLWSWLTFVLLILATGSQYPEIFCGCWRESGAQRPATLPAFSSEATSIPASLYSSPLIHQP